MQPPQHVTISAVIEEVTDNNGQTQSIPVQIIQQTTITMPETQVPNPLSFSLSPSILNMLQPLAQPSTTQNVSS